MNTRPIRSLKGMDDDDLLRLAEVAAMMHVHPSTLYDGPISSGKLKSIRISPRNIRVRVGDVRDFLRESTRGGTRK